MTHPRLKEIEARLAAATQGPFTQTRDLSTVELSVGEKLWLKLESDDYGTEESCKELSQRFSDADFIAHAPADLALCLSVIEEMRTALEMYADGSAFDFERSVRGEINFSMALSQASARQALARVDELLWEKVVSDD